MPAPKKKGFQSGDVTVHSEQKELGERVEKEEAVSGSASVSSPPPAAELTPKEEKLIVSLAAKPFVTIGEEHDVPETGHIKVMELSYKVTVKVPGPPTEAGLPTFEDKVDRLRCNSTEDVEPDYLPLIRVSCKIHPGGREKEVWKVFTLKEFFDVVKTE